MADVRAEGNKDKYLQTIAMSVFWLALMSFVMTECLEKLGLLLGIDAMVMGITFSAAGTSFPNVFASMLVARQGLGNAAISNALGGNVFNIFMGLGLPWFLCECWKGICVVSVHIFDKKISKSPLSFFLSLTFFFF